MGFAPIYTCEEIRGIEQASRDSPLMERAGTAAAAVAASMIKGRKGPVLVLAGPGNNGGDGFVTARKLKEAGHAVAVIFASDPQALPADAAAARQAWLAAGGRIAADLPTRRDWALVIDAIFGIGLTRALEDPYADWVDHINRLPTPILALDVPSGLAADSGVAFAHCVRATQTATFIGLKPGLLTADGVDYCGQITVCALDLDAAAVVAPQGHTIDWPAARALFPPRRRNCHKGDFGTLGIIGGADGMVGAALLAGRAALHLGAGKVWVSLLAHNGPAVDPVHPELMLRDHDHPAAADTSALVLGTGLGSSENAKNLLVQAIRVKCPLVLDADALNCLARMRPMYTTRLAQRDAATVLTPHPGEAARLLRCTVAEIQQDRLGAAKRLAAKLNSCVVIKGAGSVYAVPDGIWGINRTGNPGLASGGTGDVLSGMIGAFLAQGMPVAESLVLAVGLHGAAADALVAEGVGPVGMCASELPAMARRLLNQA
ncbi:MAG: NAD(P)H-hydrate dehydratase [Betaproteobacteria bacterium]|nr:NAD(P)H-hydrate dehydratase [Betaproteobacteria bacterium]